MCSPSGNNFISKFSIASIPNSVVVTRAAKLGVALGSSPSQITASIDLIKRIDLQRTLVMLKKNEDKVRKGDESLNSMVLDKSILLTEDLQEEEQKGSEGHNDLDPPLVKKK